MKQSRGFTLIEIIVTVTVMVILMAISIVALRSTQANARDVERKTDVESIARGLEIRYNQGNPKVNVSVVGSYPGINETLHAQGWDRAGFTPTQVVGGYLTSFLPGTSEQTFRSPGSSTNDFAMWCVYGGCATESTAQKLVDIDNFTTTSKYTYSPLDSNNNICCCGNCTKFNLYYRTEVDGLLKTVKSKHQ